MRWTNEMIFEMNQNPTPTMSSRCLLVLNAPERFHYKAHSRRSNSNSLSHSASLPWNPWVFGLAMQGSWLWKGGAFRNLGNLQRNCGNLGGFPKSWHFPKENPWEWEEWMCTEHFDRVIFRLSKDAFHPSYPPAKPSTVLATQTPTLIGPFAVLPSDGGLFFQLLLLLVFYVFLVPMCSKETTTLYAHV